MTETSGVAVGGPTALAVDALAQHPDLAKLGEVLQAPQTALRARLNAVVLDLVLLGFVSQILAGGAASASSSERALIFLVAEFAYFFVFEISSSQTIGKRVFRVRVVTTSGAPASARQIALRNVLRVVDALPFLYAS